MSNCRKCLLSVIFCFTFLTLVIEAAKQNEIICKSTTIRTVNDFNKLQNCTVIAGNVRIVLMQLTQTLLQSIEPSNVEEIVGYLLVYRVEGLDSLERLFPKLIVIRGVELLYDKYALVIIDNLQLQNIGLISLLRVLKGSIRVESNPSLCFTDTINWETILGNSTSKYMHVMKQNRPSIRCPLCYSFKQEEIEFDETDRHKHCWSFGKFQRYTSDCKNEENCNSTVPNYTPYTADYGNEERCSPTEKENSNCLTSCNDNNCRYCTNYISDNRCMDNCVPPAFRLAYERQCVSDCSQLNLINFGSRCVEKCPKHYRQVMENGKIACTVNCTGNFRVMHIEDLEGFSDCSIIKGSLTIELFDIKKPIIQYLEKAFGNLNEITGYLKIIRSPQIVSLNFFKKLHTISGTYLIENKYALFVTNNQHLEELWSYRQVAILHGRVYFHFNPRLCFDKIEELQDNLKENPKINPADASHTSNGERVVCGNDIYSLFANVTDFNSESALIEHEVLRHQSLESVQGFIYYYKEAPEGNVTKYDGRHGCGRDGWFMEITESKQTRYILKNLKPFTRYAYFIDTITSVDFYYPIDFESEIQYFRTKPDKPGPVAKLYIHHKSTNELEINWWPPRRPNGIIDKYVLQFQQFNDTEIPKDMYTSPAKQQEICECSELDSQLSGAIPNEEDYYAKEETIHMNSVMNFVYVKKVRKSTENRTKLTPKEEEEFFARIENAMQKGADEKQLSEKDLIFINHPLAICYDKVPEYEKLQENCTPMENYQDSYQIPGHIHSFTLTKLQPAIWYRISLRACVQYLTIGCGPEKVILAQTVSQSLKSVLDSFKFTKI